MKPLDMDGLSQREVADILGVSHQRVAQIERDALQKLRQMADLPGPLGKAARTALEYINE